MRFRDAILGHDAFEAGIEEVFFERVVKLRVRLDRERGVAVDQRSVLAELRRRQHFGTGRSCDDLILMDRVDAHGRRSARHPRRFGDEAVFMMTDAPALVGFHHSAAERARNHLMAEADADEWHAGLGCPADERFQCDDPVELFVDAVARAGDQPGVSSRRVIRHVPVQRGDTEEREIGACITQQVFEHRRIAAVACAEIFGRAARLDNADLHLCSHSVETKASVRPYHRSRPLQTAPRCPARSAPRSF